MYENDLKNGSDDEAVVTIPPLVPNSQRQRTDRFHSRVTRDGIVSLEIEIPRDGISCGSRCCLLLSLTVAFGFVFSGIVFGAMTVVNNGWHLYPDSQSFSAFVVILVLFTLCGVKHSAFDYTNLRITRNNYCLLRRGVTCCSFLQILCIPSHFDDLENGNAIETVCEDSQHPRRAPLKAEIETHVVEHQYRDVEIRDGREIVTYRTEYSEWKDIKLGAISFAAGLDDEELGWLVEEINRFLRDTS